MGAQVLGPTGVIAASGENAWSECQLLVGSLLRGFTTCKEMLPSCCFPLAIRVMFMAAVLFPPSAVDLVVPRAMSEIYCQLQFCI